MNKDRRTPEEIAEGVTDLTPTRRGGLNEARRVIAEADISERSRARQLTHVDEREAAWADEVVRRWRRRRNEPWRAFREAVRRALGGGA